jgi:hypothetical protein
MVKSPATRAILANSAGGSQSILRLLPQSQHFIASAYALLAVSVLTRIMDCLGICVDAFNWETLRDTKTDFKQANHYFVI